jgi:hypothetical protein
MVRGVPYNKQTFSTKVSNENLESHSKTVYSSQILINRLDEDKLKGDPSIFEAYSPSLIKLKDIISSQNSQYWVPNRIVLEGKSRQQSVKKGLTNLLSAQIFEFEACRKVSVSGFEVTMQKVSIRLEAALKKKEISREDYELAITEIGKIRELQKENFPKYFS